MSYDTYTIVKEDFGGGEISPMYRGKIASAEYKTGSSLMYNALPVGGGWLRRRPGTRWIDTLSFTGNVRKIPFTAVYGQKFALVIGRPAGVPTVYIYSLATHALVTSITTNVPAYANADLPAITWAQSGGVTWLFMRGTAAGTAGGTPVCTIQNAASDGSGAWTAALPTFTNGDAGGETFNAANHYPGCGEFYGGRLHIASTNTDPLAEWACTLPVPGVAQTYLILTVGSATAKDGIFLRQNDLNAPFINWLFASQSILMGTDRAVWMYPDGITGTPPTPAGFWMKKSATYGSLRNARPVQVNNVALYLGSDAKSFRSLILSTQRGFFADGELSSPAEHLMSRLCVDFCVTVRPDPTAWIRMADGSIVSASVKQEDSGFIVKAGCGFAQDSLGGGGLVVEMCVLENTNWDELWLTVNRGGTLTLEYLYLDDVTLGPQSNAVYVDCSQTQSGAPASTFNGLPAILNGKTCWAYGDGGVIKGTASAPLQPSGGSVTLPSGSTPVSVFTIGLPYYSAWQDVYPEVPAKGSSQGKIKKLEKSWLRLVNSLGAWIGQVMPADPLNHPETTLTNYWGQLQIFGIEKYGNAPAWITMDVPVSHAESAATDGRVLIVVADPVPFNLALITTRVALSEN